MPRVIISLASSLHDSNDIQAYFLASEFFLWIQIVLWLGVLSGGGGRRINNNNFFNYFTCNHRAIQNRVIVSMDKSIQEDKNKH